MRKRAVDVRETGDRILDAAMDRFSSEPYLDVTVASIAAEAGCSEQTIYRRFGSKEGVFRALHDRVDRAIRSHRDAVPRGDVTGAVQDILDDYEDLGDVMVLLQTQEGRVEVIGEATAEARRQHEGWVEDVFSAFLAELPEAVRRRALGQLVVALDVQSWRRLRRDLGLGREETARAMEEMIRAVLAHHGSDDRKDAG